MMIELEQRLCEAEALPLFERVDKCTRLMSEILVLLKNAELDPADRAELTKLRAKIRYVKNWWEPRNAPQRKKGFPALVTRGRKGKQKTIEQPKE